MKRPIARPPRRDEIDLLHKFIFEEYNDTSEHSWNEAAGFIRSAGIAVIDNYVTDGPGYAGRVMFVVWPAAPSTHEVFTFDDIVPCQQDGHKDFDCPNPACFGRGHVHSGKFRLVKVRPDGAVA